MADRRRYFYRELISDARLNAGFDDLEQADWDLLADQEISGIWEGLVASEHSPNNLTIDVTGGLGYDEVGRRLRVPTTAIVNLAVDENGASTTVLGASNERWLSVFLEFNRELLDLDTDGNSLPVYKRQPEFFAFKVAMGTEAASGAATRPGLDPARVLICDVLRTQGVTTIVNAAISTTRRQDAIVIAGTPHALRTGRLITAIESVLGWVNAHVVNAAGAHAASAVSYAGGGAWADGTTNPATTVQLQLTKTIADLAASTGSAKVGGAAIAGTATTIPAGAVSAQLAALKLAANIEYAGGPSWIGGVTNPATSVELALDSIPTVLGAATGGISSGAYRIGLGALSNWLGGRTNPATNVGAQMEKFILDLAASGSGDDGMERIGGQTVSGSPTSLSSGSARSQVDELLVAVNARARVGSDETITGAWQVDGAWVVNGAFTLNVAPLISGTTNTVSLGSRSSTKCQFGPAVSAAGAASLFPINASTGDVWRIPLALPHGQTLNSVELVLDPGVHSNLPSSMPTFGVYRHPKTSGVGSVLIGALQTDGSPDIATYNPLHSIVATPLAHVVDNETNSYYAIFTMEDGVDAVGGVVAAVIPSCTIVSISPWR